jgi:uncharacterized protein (TIGR02594 family)
MAIEIEKYTVTAVALNIRIASSKTSKIIGHLVKGDVIEELAVSEDGQWIKHKHNKITGWSSKNFLSKVTDDIPIPPVGDFPWTAIASKEIGILEIPGKEHNPRVLEYLQTVTNISDTWKSTDETPWCSAFVNWCVEQAGYVGTKSAVSASWLNWGRKIDKPIKGCITIFSRKSGGGHVGFYWDETPTMTETYIQILGGNQETLETEIGGVNLKHYKKSRLLGCRIPK